jgi:hypothetical protein
MDVNNTFNQASTTLVGLAEYYGILQNENKINVPVSIFTNMFI